MIIVGAGGFARQLYDLFIQLDYPAEIAFFDNLSPDLPERLYDRPVLRSKQEARAWLVRSSSFCLGLSGSDNRRSMVSLFSAWGGTLETVISPYARVARHVKQIGRGSVILTGAIVENDVYIGEGVLINNQAMVHHESHLSDYCEIAPGANLLGKVRLESEVFVGAQATVLPGIHVGGKAVIGAGAVVTRNVREGIVVIGNPAKIQNS